MDRESKLRERLQQDGREFRFTDKRGVVNWRELASVDVERIIREGDVSALDTLLPQIISFDALEESKHRWADRDFLSLIQANQMLLEYIIHVNEALNLSAQRLAEETRALSKEAQQITDDVKQKKEEVESVKLELRKTRKSLGLLNSLYKLAPELNKLSQPGPIHQCFVCQKMFSSFQYLELHMQRRHPAQVEALVPASPPPSPSLEQLMNKWREQIREEAERLKVENSKMQEECLRQLQLQEISSLRKSVSSLEQLTNKWREQIREEAERLKMENSKMQEECLRQLQLQEISSLRKSVSFDASKRPAAKTLRRSQSVPALAKGSDELERAASKAKKKYCPYPESFPEISSDFRHTPAQLHQKQIQLEKALEREMEALGISKGVERLTSEQLQKCLERFGLLQKK